ncbi:MAG: protease HtpX [Gammaproteobacteria bacterium]|nr:MAG: protease HtpX [Gammaproteobacteria bacterium]
MRILLFIATNIAVLALASVTLSLLGVGGMLDETGTGLNLTSLLIFCGVIGMSGSIISLFMSKWMAKRSTGTQLIEQPRTATERWLVDTVRELSEEAGIGMPEVGIFDAAQPNAFATGWNRNDSLVAVSSGLMRAMRPEEVRAVLAHEVGHVANGDMVTLALVQGVVNTFVMFFARIIGFFVDRVIFKNDRGLGPGYWIVTIVAQIVLGILAMMIVMWFSRFREYRADTAGAKLAGREHMISALERLRVGSEMPDAMPASMQAFGINQGLRQGMQALYASHPPLEDRIAALKNAA